MDIENKFSVFYLKNSSISEEGLSEVLLASGNGFPCDLSSLNEIICGSDLYGSVEIDDLIFIVSELNFYFLERSGVELFEVIGIYDITGVCIG